MFRMAGLLVLVTLLILPQFTCADEVTITHGPMLGRLSTDGIGVWARTSQPGEFGVRYRLLPERFNNDTDVSDKSGRSVKQDWQQGPTADTRWEDDCTGHVLLKGLQPGRRYQYQLTLAGKPTDRGGTFRTLHDPHLLVDKEHNPRGLYNFRFEFACGNNQNPDGGLGPSLPTYDTMLREIKDKIDFAILNGDWLYEEHRDYQLPQWKEKVGIADDDVPHNLKVAPSHVAMWENYKSYLGRAKNLQQWHANVPSYFTFDDHEIINDVYGSGEIGRVDRRAVFRDIGVAAWRDYLGWANPVEHEQDIQFGMAGLEKGSDILEDTRADFTKLDMIQATNLHVHWGGPHAAQKDQEFDEKPGNPNAGVYEIVNVIDKHRLKIRPAARADGRAAYSIGRKSFGKFRVSNCDFYLLDTRSERQMHDVRNPAKRGVSMLGGYQTDWLISEMKQSDADFFFVVSSVNFMIPHVGGGGVKFETANKDDAWTVFLQEREKLIDVWDKLGKPVFVLTGDLHNSYAIKITDRVWEFASGPHNSVNHRPQDEGDRPMTGRYKYGPRECEIRWSTTAKADIPRENRHFPSYCVVQVNNVFNNPLEKGGTRRIAFEQPQVIFQYYDGLTGDLRYAEAISLTSESKLIEKAWQKQPQGTAGD